MTTFAAITSTFNTDDLSAYTIICQYLPLAIHLHDDERIMYYIKQAHLCWDHQWDGWDKTKNITITTTINENTTLSIFDASLQLIQTLYQAITAYPPQHSHATIIKMTSLATRMLKPRHAWSLNEEWKEVEEEEKKEDVVVDGGDEKKEEKTSIVECINGVAIRHSNPILHQLTPRPLTLPWRPLYDLVARSFWSSHRSFPISHHQQHHWSTTLRDLVVHARRYFHDNASHEILELFAWTHISPRDQEMFYRIHGLTTLFIPTYTPAHQAATRVWLPDIIKHSIHLDIHNEAATHVYFSLLARVAKHVKGIVWDEYATHIFHILLQTLDLDVSGASSQHGTRAWPTSYFLLPSRHIVMEEIVKEFAIWCIHTYNPKIQSLLDQLFTTVQTYYHPSNQGKWTNYLGTLMAELARAYAERMGHEKRREVVYGKEYQLDPNDTKFVSTLRPLAFQALFSKSQHMISCAERTLRHLTYLFPHELFPSLLQQCCDALQDVTSSHRMMSAMHVLAAVAGPMVHRQLHPQGAGQLEQLMWLCLPGIDITDLMKTTRTMVWLGILFHYVPLIDARTTPSGTPLPSPSSPTETSDDARATTMRFEEWSVQFLESVLKNLTIIDKYAKKDFIDVQFARLLFRCMRSFFASLSIPILDVLIKKLVTFLTHDHHPHAIKHFGIICHAITSSHSNRWLAAIFPPLYNKLIVTDAKGVTSISSHAESELEWSLYLLSSSVKHAGGDGEVLTPYIDRIRTLYTATLSHDEKKIRKHGLKLIRNTLKSLTMVYPREYHNVDPSTWNDPKWIHYETWGDYIPATPPDVVIPDIGLEWHVPNNNEMKHATKIVELTLQQPLSILQSVAQGHVIEEKFDGKHESAMERAVRQVLNTCRGIHAVMGMIKGKPILPHDYDRDVDEHVTDKAKATSPTNGTSMTWITSTGRCPLVIPTRRPPQTPMVYSYIPVDSNLRTYLLRLCHSLLTKLVPVITISRDTSHATQPALHAITLIVKLIRILIQLYGVVPMKLHFDQWQSTVTRTILREYYTGYEPTPMRALYISHAWDRYHTRLIDLSYGQTYTIDVRHIMDDLRILATHDFIKLRDRARDILMMTCQHFPLGIHDTITYMLDVITNKSSTEEQLMGAISMLSQQPVHRWVCNRWSRLSPFILTLCQYGEQHHDDKVQVALQQLFSAMYPDMHRLPLTIPPVTSTSHIPDDIIAQRNDALSRLNTRLLSGYQHLIRSLLSLLSSSQPLHWKYQLMGASFLYSLLRADMPDDEITTTCYHDIILFFSRGLVSELLPLRKIAMIAMTHILGTHTIATRKRVNDIPSSESKDDSKICITTPTSEDEWLSTSFQDYAAINWDDDINHIIRTVYRKCDNDDTYAYSIIRGTMHDPFPFQYASSLPPASGLVARAIPTSTLHALHPLLIKSLPSLIDSIVHNHPSLAPANEGSSAQHASGGQSGAGDQIASAVYHHAPTRWPYVRCRQQGHAYDTIHVNLIRGIVETFPDMISSLSTQITRLTTAPHDRENQCAAAEIFAGIIRGSRHLTYQHQIAVQQQLTTSVIPALETCQPDSVAFWYDACHQAITNKDGRRVAWLTRSLLSSAFGSLPDMKTDDTDMDAILESALARVDISPSIQFKRFHFLIPFLAEPSIRMDHCTVWLLDQIRDGFMESPFKQVREEVGHVLCEITVALYQDTQETSPILWSFIKHIRDRLAAATAIIEAERTQHRSDIDHKPKHLLQTITYWLASGLNHGDYLEIHDVVVTFLPYLLQHHHHPDPEISAMCKYVTSLIAWSNMRTATTDIEITTILDGIIPVMKNDSWHARVALLKFLQVFVPRHSLVLTAAHRSSIENIITTLLTDPQIEVREAASILLSAALTSASTSSTVEEWITKAMKWAKTKIKKANENGKQDGLSTRHAGVIVLSSIVLTHPYDVPDYLPRILATLSTHASDVESIASGVRKTFADFTRTHKDEWESLFKEKFTEDELEALQSVVSAPTYFA